MSNERRQILLVEDNEVNRNMLIRRLERAGHAVITAADGETALEVMRAASPGVVLMDMNLPIKDGWTACREAQAAIHGRRRQTEPLPSVVIDDSSDSLPSIIIDDSLSDS